ncbi:Peroxisome biosynthesis protein pex1 [Phlyctochytrium planicorne]|nr:Peroxisome biosynthesis protein pex1 [Phlyctochytrium planicorne]
MPDAKCVRLGYETEVIVAPKVRRLGIGESKDLSTKVEDPIQATRKHPLRVLRLEGIEGLRYDNEKASGFSCFVSASDFRTIMGLQDPDGNKSPQIVAIRPIQFRKDKGNDETEDTPATEFGRDTKSTEESTLKNKTSVRYFWMYSSPHVPLGHVALGLNNRDALNISSFERVMIHVAPRAPIPLKNATISVHAAKWESEKGETPEPIRLRHNASGEMDEKILSAFKDWIVRTNVTKSLILTSGSVLNISNSSIDESVPFPPLFISIEPKTPDSNLSRQDKFTVVNVIGIADVSINIGKAVVLQGKRPQFREEILEDISLGELGGVLVTGNRGFGKTSIIKKAAYEFSHSKEIVADCTILDCASIQSLALVSIRQKFKNMFMKAVWCSPSVIFLDNLDRLTPSHSSDEVTGGGESGDPLRSVQISEIIRSELELVHKLKGNVVLVATAIERHSIAQTLLGTLTFVDFLSIKSPDKHQRQEIVKAILKDLPVEPERLDYLNVATSTEGFSPSNLKSLMERAVHIASIDAINAGGDVGRPNSKPRKSPKIKLSQGHMTVAMKEYVPPSMRGLKASDSGVAWADIGGLVEAKIVLRETLEWPTKYREIFRTCPLRLRSGLLLYGYPGCGKTLLASAVAKECGLNFISVKGPEILNKYIGASEKAVRDLFDRAQAARPCILFFDEFESIAPRRGNDNTGVTDRVVNQMLTAMDGAEGLDGVYVLAATRKFTVADDVDWKRVAQGAEGFSGADLQGLIYSASLESIHSYLSKNPSAAIKKETSKSDDVVGTITEILLPSGQSIGPKDIAEAKAKVHKILSNKANSESQRQAATGASGDDSFDPSRIEFSHVLAALRAAKPSVAADERRRYERIFAEFSGEVKPSEKRIGKKTMMG